MGPNPFQFAVQVIHFHPTARGFKTFLPPLKCSNQCHDPASPQALLIGSSRVVGRAYKRLGQQIPGLGLADLKDSFGLLIQGGVGGDPSLRVFNLGASACLSPLKSQHAASPSSSIILSQGQGVSLTGSCRVSPHPDRDPIAHLLMLPGEEMPFWWLPFVEPWEVLSKGLLSVTVFPSVGSHKA